MDPVPALNVKIRQRRRWIIATALLTLLLTAAAGTVYLLDLGASGSLDKAVREYRAAGLPWVQADLNLPKIPEGQNAAPAFLEISKDLKDFDDKAFEREVADLFQVDKLREAQAKIDTQSRHIQKAIATSRLPYFRIPDDVDWGVIRRFPEVMKVVRLLRLDAEHAARTRRHTRAIELLRAIERIAELVQQEPQALGIFNGRWARVTLYSSAAKCTWYSYRNGFLPLDYEMFLMNPEERSEVERIFVLESYVGVATIRNLYSLPPNGSSDEVQLRWMQDHEPLREGVPNVALVRGFMARHLEDRLGVWSAMKSEKGDLLDLQRSLKKHESRARPVRLSRLMAELMDQDLSSTVEAFNRAEAVRRCSLAAVRYIEQMRVTGGLAQRPGGLPEPNWLPEDVFAPGKRLRFDWVNKRRAIWSVGPNGKDDGGKNDKEAGQDDIAIHLMITRGGR